MFGKIDNKYYVKVSNFFHEVIPEITKDDVILKPTSNRVEITPSLKYIEIDMDSIKKEILSGKKEEEKVELKKEKPFMKEFVRSSRRD